MKPSYVNEAKKKHLRVASLTSVLLNLNGNYPESDEEFGEEEPDSLDSNYRQRLQHF